MNLFNIWWSGAYLLMGHLICFWFHSGCILNKDGEKSLLIIIVKSSMSSSLIKNYRNPPELLMGKFDLFFCNL
jgi:hypothetical protein